ncbi:MAG: hypothetical protein Q8882_04350 [Bacillota bacterium]|nr:hypothetical protein [Bacillota bacterium]
MISENEFLKGGETAAAYFGEVNPTLSKRRAFKEETMDWTKVWSKKYSILKDYESVIDTRGYEGQLGSMIAELMREYDLGRQDAFLVLKDILYKEYLKGKDEKNV